jgi:hypothetical protein
VARTQNGTATPGLMPDDGAAEKNGNTKGPNPRQAEVHILSWREVR